MSYYVIVRGPLGVGKTAVSSALADALGAHRISIDAILDRPGLEEWEDGRITERSFLRVNELAVSEAEPVLRRGTPVVFDGNFYYRSQIEDLVGRLDFPHAAFTLQASLSDCIERDRGRPVSYGEEAAAEVFALVSGVTYGVDVDARRPVPAVVAEILRRLRSPPAANPLER
jgi:hypothetical protein